MADIGNLVVKLQAQTDAFKRKMNDAKSAVGRFSDDAKNKLAVIQKGFNLAGAAIGAVIKTMTAGAGVAAGFFAAMTVKAGTIKELQQLSQVTGVAVENLQRWQFAAKAVGIEADKMGSIMSDAAEKLGELAATGGGEAKEVFEKLGLDAREFAKIPVDEALLKIAKRMDGLTENERNALFEMMASDARELIPLLENNAEKFRELTAEGEKIGAFLSEGAIAGAVRFRERWDDLIQRAQAFTTQLTAALAPSMETILGKITEWIDEFGGMEQVAQSAAKWMLTSVQQIIQGFESLLSIINEVKLAYNTVVGTGQAAGGIISRGIASVAGSTPLSIIPGMDALEEKALMMGESFDAVANQTAEARVKMINDAEQHSQRVQSIIDTLEEAKQQIGKTEAGTGASFDKTRQATEYNTDAIRSLSETIKTETETRKRMSLTEGGRTSESWDLLIKRARTIAGSTQASATDAAVFENAARAMIARFEGAGGFDTDAMRAQMDEILARMGEGATGLKETAQTLTGEGGKSMGTITINVTSDKGTTSGEVTGESSFLQKLASTLSSVATAV